jgi:sigma-B regulation protein RsbU (phosphoserine phosphatase)
LSPAGARGPRRKRSARRPALVLDIPAATEYLSVAHEASKRAAQLAGLQEKDAENVALAVDECTTNVIQHAYRGVRDKRIELRLEYRGLDLVIEVVDAGRPVDKKAVPKVDLERYAAERRKGGLGVHMMEKIMDSVSFRREARRNVCRMLKHKPDTAREH